MLIQNVPYFIDSGYLLVPCRMVINELYILEISKSDDQDNLATGNTTTDIFPMYRKNMKLKESLPNMRQDYAHGSNFEIIYKFKSIDNAKLKLSLNDKYNISMYTDTDNVNEIVYRYDFGIQYKTSVKCKLNNQCSFSSKVLHYPGTDCNKITNVVNDTVISDTKYFESGDLNPTWSIETSEIDYLYILPQPSAYRIHEVLKKRQMDKVTVTLVPTEYTRFVTNTIAKIPLEPIYEALGTTNNFTINAHSLRY